jgi:glycosyltransferase involved in cell wall biosynthesis
MRICYFADGRYIHALRWMRYFAKVGHEMHLISFAEVLPEQIAELESAGVKYHGHTGNFHIKKPWLTLKDLRFIKSVLRKEKIDILNSHFLGANAWYAALSGFHPHVITIMGGGDVIGPDWKPDSSLQAKFLTPYSLRNADQITSWSRLMADVVRPYCRPGTPIDVVHGGIHLEKFFPGAKPDYLLERWRIPREARVIFSPRLMRPLSNIDRIAAAAGSIVNEDPNVYFVFARPEHVIVDEHAMLVEKVLQENGAISNTRFVGAIQHQEMADYFRLADVTVSIPDTDGTPMTVLESMACGTPTVIGDLPDYDREYFENEKTTMMVDVRSPKLIAKSMLRLLNDKPLAEAISNEARRRVEETGSYEFQMGKMDDIYQSLVK